MSSSRSKSPRRSAEGVSELRKKFENGGEKASADRSTTPAAGGAISPTGTRPQSEPRKFKLPFSKKSPKTEETAKPVAEVKPVEKGDDAEDTEDVLKSDQIESGDVEKNDVEKSLSDDVNEAIMQIIEKDHKNDTGEKVIITDEEDIVDAEKDQDQHNDEDKDEKKDEDDGKDEIVEAVRDAMKENGIEAASEEASAPTVVGTIPPEESSEDSEETGDSVQVVQPEIKVTSEH